LYKRLHRALFVVPEAEPGARALRIDAVALRQLLSGVAHEKKKRERRLH
jgi:hypothetical protein